jgi:hypothetical protein
MSIFSFLTTSRGFLLADGPGVGKGRQLAAMMHEYNIACGNSTRIIFVTCSRSLEAAIKSDLQAVSGNFVPVYQLQNSEPIPLGDGILFATYAFFSRNSTMGSRIDRVVEWVDGKKVMIVMDECHIVQKCDSSRSGIAMKTLKRLLPGAFVVYSRCVFSKKTRQKRCFALVWGVHEGFF